MRPCFGHFLGRVARPCAVLLSRSELGPGPTSPQPTQQPAELSDWRWVKSGDGYCADANGVMDKYGEASGNMISWTRNGGGEDDSLAICQGRCQQSSGCRSIVRDSSDGECILYSVAYVSTTGPAGANSWECWHLSEVAEPPWSIAEWAVALRFDHLRATVLVLLPG